MLRQVELILPRVATGLAVGVLGLALVACSSAHRLKPGSETGAEVKTPPGSDQPYPHLGDVPDRPKQAETADSRREIARDLIADREAARYTDQALRGGTEPSAPPPPAPVSSVQPLESTASLDKSVKLAENRTETKKPGFFARLFGAKEEEPAASNEPAPLPAQPTGTVDVQQAPPAK